VFEPQRRHDGNYAFNILNGDGLESGQAELSREDRTGRIALK